MNIFQGILTSTLGRFIVTGLVLSLTVTGGLFAYAYTSDTGSITVTSGSNDFANVTDNVTVTAWKVFGSYRGTIGSGTLFNVTPTTDYPGDMEVNVYLSNMDDMGKTYGMFLMRLTLVDSTNTTIDKEGIAKPLTLQNGVVSFIAESGDFAAGTTYFIKTTGGVYRAYAWAYLSGKTLYGPTFHAEVVQAG